MTEWEFPKGRRNYMETDIKCALREFQEETGISKESIKIINDRKLENENDLKELKQLIKNHKKFTGSAVATRILKDWNNSILKFVKVMPTDYKRVMMELNETKLKVS